MKKILFSLIAVPLLAGLFTSCGEGSNAPVGDWQLVFFEKAGVAQAICLSTLNVQNDGDSAFTVAGFAGVNNFFGKAEASKDGIKVGDIATTRMLGPDAAMDFERDYLAALGAADSWKAYKQEGIEWLEIASSAQDALVRFTKIYLKGTSWKISSMYVGYALVSSDADITLSFISDDKINGNTGINVINFGYKADPKTHALSFSEGQITMAAGSPEETEAEMFFLQNLKKIAAYEVSGNKLMLRDADGNVLLEFTKADVMTSLYEKL